MVVLPVFIIGEACGGVACWRMQVVSVRLVGWTLLRASPSERSGGDAGGWKDNTEGTSVVARLETTPNDMCD